MLSKWIKLSTFFTLKEVMCPCGCGFYGANSELLDKLDQIRIGINRPLIATSICRCSNYDRKLALKDNKFEFDTGLIIHPDYLQKNLTIMSESRTSSHILGFASDILVNSSHERYEIKYQAYKCNISRIGNGPNFIHVDIDPNKPQQVEWNY